MGFGAVNCASAVFWAFGFKTQSEDIITKKLNKRHIWNRGFCFYTGPNWYLEVLRPRATNQKARMRPDNSANNKAISIEDILVTSSARLPNFLK